MGCGKSQQEALFPEDAEFEKNFKRITAEMEKRDESLSEATRGLFDAVDKGNIEELKKQLASGADVNAHGGVEFPINRATQFGHKAIIELLISKGADVNVEDPQGYTPLHRVAFDGHKKMAELLIANGADVNVRNGWKAAPLDEAIAGSQIDKPIADLLRKHGAKTGEELKAAGN